MPLKLPRALPIYIATGAFFSGLAMRGFLVPLRAHEVGASRASVGLLFALMTLSAAVLSIPAGQLADRFGRRRTVAISALIAGLTQLLIGATDSVHGWEVLQVLGGLGAGGAQAALFAAVGDAAPAGRIGRAMGWASFSMQIGFLAGPALGGLLLNVISLREALIYSTVLYAVPLVAAALLPAHHSHPGKAARLVPSVLLIARRPGFTPLVVGVIGAAIVWGTSQAYLPLWAKESLGIPGSVIGVMLAVQAVVNALARIPGGRMVDRTSRKGPLVAVGVAGYAVAVGLLPFTSSTTAATVVLAAGTPFIALAFIAISVAFSGLADARSRGVAMGVYSAMLFLGLSVGPAAFGVVMQTSGYRAGFASCAVVATALAGIMLGVRTLDRRRRPAVILPPAAPGA